MSASNVSGKVLSLWLAQGHNTCIMLIISISIQVMLVSTVVHRSTASTVLLSCNKDNQQNEWSPPDEDGCSDELIMSVIRVHVYNKECKDSMPANNATFKAIVKVCDGKRKCEVDDLATAYCVIYPCVAVEFTCNSTLRRGGRNKSTTEKIITDKDGDNENKDIHTNGVTKKPTNARSTAKKTTKARITKTTDATSTDNHGTNENMNNGTDSMDMNVPIFVAVSVVAFVATVIAVTLCLLVFCCQKSPLYRRNIIISRRDPQQQCQGEYDYVDESTMQDLIPSPEDSSQHHGVFCVSPQHGTTSRAYQNAMTSDYEHYEGVSANESPESTNRTTPSSHPNLSVTIIPVKSKLLKTASSNSGSPQLVDKFNTGETHTGNREGGASGRFVYSTTEDPQQGIYSLASPVTSSSGAGPATCFNVLSVAGDYAHLTRAGEAPQAATDNVYDG